MQVLSANIGVQIKPVFQTMKIGQVLAPKEKKRPIVNNQCVVYKFECDLCDADYVGYTARHLHQRINEHKYSTIGKHLEQHGLLKNDLADKQLSVLKKCRSKFDCLIFEMLFIKELNPELNTLFAPNSFRDSACEYFVICILPLCYPCLLGILLHLYSFSFHSVILTW